MKRIAVLGSTGSIGRQALDVARWRGYEVVALAAGSNADELLSQVHEFAPALVACHPRVADRLKGAIPRETRLLTGPEGAEAVAVSEVDVVLAAIPGYDGLAPTAAALRAGRDVALANKEAMVVAGRLMWEIATASGARITPVDSEHSALFQALQGEPRDAIERLVLTASGGPFREAPADLAEVTPAQALRHPTWNMGPKVTVDSATLFNKGLEVLEAHVLFDVPLDAIEVVIHPQSLVHGLVRFTDGSIKAQIGPHDMRLPIQYALEAPLRPPTPLPPLPLEGAWEFAPPDTARFPSLALAYLAGERGGVAPAYLNAADEIAVDAFLSGRIGFLDIPRVVAEVLDACPDEALSWDAIRRADADARDLARRSARWADD